MSVIQSTERLNAAAETKGNRSLSLPQRFLKFACSVRLGVALLIMLVAASMIGMLVMQQNIEGFANYFATLTPAQRAVYGKLGFFDIYHTWYFNALIFALSLNIVLSTIDRLPKIWPFFSRPSVTVPLRWLKEQKTSTGMKAAVSPDEAVAAIESTFRGSGLRRVRSAEKNGRTFIFGESGRWNRLGFVWVHVALLMIFIGGFMTAQLSNNGNLPLSPGESSDIIYDTAYQLDKVAQITKQLPFEVTGVDIRQRLIRNEGSLSPSNTIDWMTWFTIKDEYGVHEAFVQMNRPYDYRGYRFFQASFTPIGRARTITLEVKPAAGGEPQQVTIDRNGTAVLADGTKIVFSQFRGNFRIGPEDPNENTSNYENPAAVLEVVPPGGIIETATAFTPQAGNIPIASKPVGGYTFKLLDFEKVSDQHVLAVQRDPGSGVVYAGFALLFVTLAGVFMFSHKRVWAVVDSSAGSGVSVTLAGNVNRNPNGFEEKFDRIKRSAADALKEKGSNG
ncbi:MAG: cytochrome c biogenesis protein ResB [Pyrinomonadaceae bacterium]|nr:cytochrome c biogenesis protein ResB [Pyrinomonadaceae bacterium]